MSFDSSLPDDRVNVSDRSAHREAIVLVAGVCALAAVFTFAIGGLVEVLLPMLPSHVEHRLLGGVWEQLPQDPDPAEDPPPPDDEAQLRALMDRLAAHWPDRQISFQVGVIESEQPNAFALPGGAVIVTSGLLEAAKSENEIAFVLGHELGHFRNRDHLRGLGRQVAWALFVGVLGLGDGSAGSLVAATGHATGRTFDRDQERDADLFGLWILGEEYGHTGGMAAVFDALLVVPEEADATESDLSSYLDTHPANDDRLEALRTEARNRGLSAEGPLTPWSIPAPASDATSPDQSGAETSASPASNASRIAG